MIFERGSSSDWPGERPAAAAVAHGYFFDKPRRCGGGETFPKSHLKDPVQLQWDNENRPKRAGQPRPPTLFRFFNSDRGDEDASEIDHETHAAGHCRDTGARS
jgi:hypothetical protein